MQDRIAAMIAKEMSSSANQSLDNVPDLNGSYGTASLSKLNALDKSKWALPAHPEGTTEELHKAQYMAAHQSLRQSNVDLAHKFGGNAWRVSNFLLEQDLGRIQRLSESVAGDMEELNRDRKTRQVKAGERLDALQKRWQDLMEGNLQLEVANVALESEVQQLQARQAALQAILAEGA